MLAEHSIEAKGGGGCCGCIVLILAVIGFCYLVGLLT